MVGKSKYRKVIWIVIFTLIVGITGYALSSTGNLRNPFIVLSQTSGQGPQFAGGTDRRPPDNAANGGVREGGPGEGGIAWSQIGGVLFNVWYLFATAYVVIVFQTVAGYVKDRLRPRKRRMAYGLA